MDNEDYELVVHPELLLTEEQKSFIPSSSPISSSHWDKKGRIRWTILLFLGCLLAYSSRTALTISAVSVGKEYGWDKKVSGVVLSSFFFGYVLTQVIGGVLSDRLGGDRMLYLSGAIWSAATFTIPFAASLNIIPVTASIIAAQILCGAAQGIHFPAIASLLSKRVAIENRNSIFSFAASGTAVGIIFSGLVGSFLLTYHGWKSVFLCVGSLSIIWVLVVRFFVFREPNTENEVTIIDKRQSIQWLKLFKIKSFWALMFCATMESLVFTNLLSWLPTYFQEQFPNSQGWLFNVFPWIASFIFQNVCGALSDKLTMLGVTRTKVRKIFVSMALFTTSGLCLILNQVQTFGTALALMSLIIGFLGCNSSGIGMNPQDLAPKHAGSLFGIMNSLGAISGTLGVYLTGHILHESNSWSSVFYMTSVVSFVGGLSFVLFGTGKQII